MRGKEKIRLRDGYKNVVKRGTKTGKKRRLDGDGD